MLKRLAPAKINLFLHVTGRFDDGYHELQTAYHLIDWCDEIEFELTSDGSITPRQGPLKALRKRTILLSLPLAS